MLSATEHYKGAGLNFNMNSTTRDKPKKRVTFLTIDRATSDLIKAEKKREKMNAKNIALAKYAEARKITCPCSKRSHAKL